MKRTRIDRRVKRTHRLLRSALFSLIQEKGFEALSVQDIIDRADVGRATFYAHFDNKDDLLVGGLDDLRASLKERQRRARAGASSLDDRVFAFSHEVFAHTDEHRELFRHMAGKRSGAMVEHLLHRMLVELIRDDVRAAVGGRRADAAPAEAVVQFLAGGLFGVVMLWLEGRIRLQVDEVNALFRRLAIPAIRAAAR